MEALELSKLLVQQAQSGKLYYEFMSVPSMSMGIYTLPAGAEDTQQPHTEDEVYYVVQGMATLHVGDEDVAAVSGNILYVPANVEHHFYNIVQDLTLLVFFAPAEYSQKGDQ